MKLKKILTLVASASFAVAAHANVTIDANGVGSNLALSSSGTPLAEGDLVRLGYFSSTSSLASSNSFATLNALFTPIGEGITNAGTLTESGTSGGGGTIMAINNFGSTAGAFLGEFDNVSSTYIGTGDQLYMWIFNATTTGSATQWGIFDAPSWTFPADPGQVTMSLGSSGVDAIRGSTDGSDFELANIPASVPEPGTLSFIGGALVAGAVGLRRRKR